MYAETDKNQRTSDLRCMSVPSRKLVFLETGGSVTWCNGRLPQYRDEAGRDLDTRVKNNLPSLSRHTKEDSRVYLIVNCHICADNPSMASKRSAESPVEVPAKHSRNNDGGATQLGSAELMAMSKEDLVIKVLQLQSQLIEASKTPMTQGLTQEQFGVAVSKSRALMAKGIQKQMVARQSHSFYLKHQLTGCIETVEAVLQERDRQICLRGPGR
jgi:hypothetical protein